MKLKLFFLALGAVLLASCGGGSSSANNGYPTVTSITTDDVNLDNLEMSVSAEGINGNKTRVGFLMKVKNSVNAAIQSGSSVELGESDSIHVMAYGKEKIAEKFVHPSGVVEYRAEFDENTSDTPIEFWYAPEVGSRFDIGRVESLGRAVPYAQGYSNPTVSVVFDTSTFPTSFVSPSSFESLKCEQGGDNYLFTQSIENPIVNDSYVHSVIDVFEYNLTNNEINISNCTFNLIISYSEDGLSFNNNMLLWGDGTVESGSITSGQTVELEFSNL